jgi:hypothetical protein
MTYGSHVSLSFVREGCDSTVTTTDATFPMRSVTSNSTESVLQGILGRKQYFSSSSFHARASVDEEGNDGSHVI